MIPKARLTRIVENASTIRERLFGGLSPAGDGDAEATASILEQWKQDAAFGSDVFFERRLT